MSIESSGYPLPGLFGRLSVTPVVNGVGPATRLGGLPLHPSILEAMADATQCAVRMDDLQDRAGRELSRLLSVPAAYVTSGAAAALTLATASLLAGDEVALVDSLPQLVGSRKRVIVLAAHRDPYDRAIEAAGAIVDVVGYPHSSHLGEIQRALTSDTIAVLYRPGQPGNHPSLRDICALADQHDIPVIVDGALYAPPLENLHTWMRDGASFVALSGGKQFRGPQASGILCGKSDLIQRVALHHQDMDERESTWTRGGGDFNTPPRHGIGRGMKVGREQIAGLVVAVDRYLKAPGADDAPGIEELKQLHGLLSSSPVPSFWHDTSVLGVPILELALADAGFDVDAVVRGLSRLDTPVILEESEAWRGVLLVNPMALLRGDAQRIAVSLDVVLAYSETPTTKGDSL